MNKIDQFDLDLVEIQMGGTNRYEKSARREGWYSSMRVGARYSAHKVLVEKATGKILGAHLIGPGVEEQINLFAMAMGGGLSANQFKAIIFAYPSYASDLGSVV